MEMRALDDHTKPEWELVAPYLDESLDQLNPADRDALVLRFLKQQDLRAVGEALGISDDAARKRVDRALEKLHVLLKHRGATLSAAALGTALATEAVTAAPAGLAASITTTAVAGAAVTSTSTQAIVTASMSWLNAKTVVAVLGAAAIAGMVTHLIEQRQIERLRAESQIAASQRETRDTQPAAVAELSTAEKQELERLRKGQADVLRLRGTVTSLRRDVAELASLRGIKMVDAFDGLRPSIGPEEACLILTRDSLEDRGLGTPEAALETYLWTKRQAMAANSFDEANRRVKEIMWIPPGVTFAGYGTRNQDPMPHSNFVKLEGLAHPTPDSAELCVTSYDRLGARGQNIYKFIRDGAAWKIDMGLKPR